MARCLRARPLDGTRNACCVNESLTDHPYSGVSHSPAPEPGFLTCALPALRLVPLPVGGSAGGPAGSAVQVVTPLLSPLFSPSGLALGAPDDPEGISPDPGSGNGGKYTE